MDGTGVVSSIMPLLLSKENLGRTPESYFNLIIHQPNWASSMRIENELTDGLPSLQQLGRLTAYSMS